MHPLERDPLPRRSLAGRAVSARSLQGGVREGFQDGERTVIFHVAVPTLALANPASALVISNQRSPWHWQVLASNDASGIPQISRSVPARSPLQPPSLPPPSKLPPSIPPSVFGFVPPQPGVTVSQSTPTSERYASFVELQSDDRVCRCAPSRLCLGASPKIRREDRRRRWGSRPQADDF